MNFNTGAAGNIHNFDDSGTFNKGVDYGYNSGLQKQSIAGENYRAGLAANAQMLPAQLRQARFNQMFPFFQQQFGNINDQLRSFNTSQGQGGGPAITADHVYTPDQIQQNVNATRAANDQTTATQTTGMQRDLAGRGFGANSPLSQALSAQFGMNNMATNSQAEQQLRFNAAGANAQQGLQAQTAREAQFANRQQEDIARKRVVSGNFGALLGALGNFAG